MSLYEKPISCINGIGKEREKLFNKLDIYSIGDLIRFYPRSYEDWSSPKKINEIVIGEKSLIKAKVNKVVSDVRINNNRLLSRTNVSDDTGVMDMIFFNNRYISSMLKVDKEYYFMGKVTLNNNSLQMMSPEFCEIEKSDRIEPIYNLTAGLNNRIIVKAVKEALNMLPKDIGDPIPENIRERFNLCSLEYALRNIHFPSSFEAKDRAKERLIFEELLILNLGMRLLKNRISEETSIKINEDYTKEFISSLPFKLTNAQNRAIIDCISDMKNKKSPMNRLVQGDVGCGKTVVSAAICYNVIKNGYQVAFMAPTEILAEQHYESFKNFFDKFGIEVELLIGSTTAKNKNKIKGRISSGDIKLVIGTHALLTEDTEFDNLGCVVIDEQHRFGVEQRSKLSKKGEYPHMMVMSATPIPRSLGLVIYGDLDISIIDELPPGRKTVKTYFINSLKRQRALNFIKQEIENGGQCYIVCPLVETGELDAEDVESYAAELMLSGFENIPIGVLHGKMKNKEKDKIMEDFINNKISLLVSTTVIEVGVDVKNATIMMIENAERFGLSQLHQLRGRVGRNDKESYCILVSDNQSESTKIRMATMVQNSNGFDIADEDLKLRGPGDFFGNKQHGLPKLKIADLSDMTSLRNSQSAAQEIINNSPDLSDPSLSYLRGEIRLLYRDYNM